MRGAGQAHASGRWLLAGLIVLGACLLAWFAFEFSRSMVLARPAAAAAVRSWRTAPAMAELGAATLVDPSGKPDVAKARRLSVAALRREPFNVEAVRTLALVHDLQGDTKRTAGLMRYSQRLSRRDLPTHLWLIERSVQQGDVAGALEHYDQALTTSFRARDILLPVLASAADDPTIADQLSRRLARRPNWWSSAAPVLVGSLDNPASLALVLRRLRLDPHDPFERSLLGPGLARMIKRPGGLAPAVALYRSATGVDPTRASAIAEDFAGVPLLPPFDWSFADDPDLTASPSGEDGQHRLEISFVDGATRPAATRLLLLKPGRYRLSAVTGAEDDAGALEVTLTCFESADPAAIPTRSRCPRGAPRSGCRCHRARRRGSRAARSGSSRCGSPRFADRKAGGGIAAERSGEHRPPHGRHRRRHRSGAARDYGALKGGPTIRVLGAP